VLDAERSLFNAQLSYTQTQGAVLTSFVTLYKAMGGGWVLEAEKRTMPPVASPASADPATPSRPPSPPAPAGVEPVSRVTSPGNAPALAMETR
jgi:multidrug efflux system outer membrane protein